MVYFSYNDDADDYINGNSNNETPNEEIKFQLNK